MLLDTLPNINILLKILKVWDCLVNLFKYFVNIPDTFEKRHGILLRRQSWEEDTINRRKFPTGTIKHRMISKDISFICSVLRPAHGLDLQTGTLSKNKTHTISRSHFVLLVMNKLCPHGRFADENARVLSALIVQEKCKVFGKSLKIARNNKTPDLLTISLIIFNPPHIRFYSKL